MEKIYQQHAGELIEQHKESYHENKAVIRQRQLDIIQTMISNTYQKRDIINQKM